jgi:hypothetical protein
MELSDAIRLTQLFRRQAETDTMRAQTMCVSMTGLGNRDTGVTFNVHTPAKAAEYIRFLANGNHPLFQRVVHHFSSASQPDPIVLKAFGYTRPDPASDEEIATMSFRMRFLDLHEPSQLSFNLDPSFTSDWATARNHVTGPTLADTLLVLDRSASWKDMSFTTLQGRSPAHAKLSLVPKG